jgi:competence protein ComEC
VQRCEAGQRLRVGPMHLDVLRPLAADYAQPRLRSNAASCVVRVTLGAHRLLLTGDVPAREEAELLAREPDLRVDWISAPHHGSSSSSSEALLDATRPKWASVQAGYRNRFGHPDPQVLGRFLARDVRVVRSDESGAAQWRFADGRATEVHRWRASAHRYWHHRPGRGAAAERALPDDDAVDPAAMLAEPTDPH